MDDVSWRVATRYAIELERSVERHGFTRRAGLRVRTAGGIEQDQGGVE